MGIDKESSGLPQTNLSRKTSKVNIAIVVSTLVFFGTMFGLYFALRS